MFLKEFHGWGGKQIYEGQIKRYSNNITGLKTDMG